MYIYITVITTTSRFFPGVARAWSIVLQNCSRKKNRRFTDATHNRAARRTRQLCPRRPATPSLVHTATHPPPQRRANTLLANPAQNRVAQRHQDRRRAWMATRCATHYIPSTTTSHPGSYSICHSFASPPTRRICASVLSLPSPARTDSRKHTLHRRHTKLHGPATSQTDFGHMARYIQPCHPASYTPPLVRLPTPHLRQRAFVPPWHGLTRKHTFHRRRAKPHHTHCITPSLVNSTQTPPLIRLPSDAPHLRQRAAVLPEATSLRSCLPRDIKFVSVPVMGPRAKSCKNALGRVKSHFAIDLWVLDESEPDPVRQGRPSMGKSHLMPPHVRARDARDRARSTTAEI